jgi:hypothetical protein
MRDTGVRWQLKLQALRATGGFRAVTTSLALAAASASGIPSNSRAVNFALNRSPVPLGDRDAGMAQHLRIVPGMSSFMSSCPHVPGRAGDHHPLHAIGQQAACGGDDLLDAVGGTALRCPSSKSFGVSPCASGRNSAHGLDHAIRDIDPGVMVTDHQVDDHLHPGARPAPD